MQKQPARLICLILLLLLAAPTVTRTALAASGPSPEAAPLLLPSEMGPIASAAFNTCALTSAGGVVCWGAGYLGNNSPFGSPTPVNVNGLSSGVKAIAAGGRHFCVLTTAGGVKCWGDNYYGQLGTNSTDNSLVPISVHGLASGVSAIAADAYHTCALTTEGGVKCWGHNMYGALGNGTEVDSHIPVNVSGLSSGVKAIALGLFYSCAVTTAGGVKCWGFNTSGQLGVETSTMEKVPVGVTNLPDGSGVEAVTTSQSTTCALLAGGGIKCWGSNSSGQWGSNSTNLYGYLPVDVYGLTSGAGALSPAYYLHLCAITTTGGAKCWGDNWNHQLGIDSDITSSKIPVDVYGLSSGVKAISAGMKHTCAMTTSGGVKCWGSNNEDQLGNYTVETSRIPVNVLFLPAFQSASAGDGWVLESSENSKVGGTLNASAATLRLGDDAARKQYRSILSFNTSGLPNNAVITKVTLKFKKQGITGGGNPVTTFQGFMLDVKKGMFGTAVLQAGDFQALPSKTFGPFSASPNSSGWYSLDLTGAKAYINKLATGGGLTQIRLRFKLDDNNDTTANYLSLYSGNAAAAARPQLIIEYYVP